jgi:hypothetical protein
MLTLSDINAITNSKDGDIYSDLYKDVYGSRPRQIEFVSIEEFDEDYQYLVRRLDAKMAEEEVTQKRNFDEFMNRIHGIMQIVQGSTRERAVEIIAVAEGIDKDEFEVYGLESLEYKFDLKFGSIAKWLSEDV